MRRILVLTLLVACKPPGDDADSGTSDGTTSPPAAPPEATIAFSDSTGPLAASPADRGYAAVPIGDDEFLVQPLAGDVDGTAIVGVARLGSDQTATWATELVFPEPVRVGGAVRDGTGVALVAGLDATVYVIRLDGEGNVASARSFEAPSVPSVPPSVAVLDDGGTLVTFGVGAARLDAGGNAVWASDVGLGSVRSAVVLPDGFAFVATSTSPHVARTDADGVVAWAASVSLGSTASPGGLARDGTDLVAVSGSDVDAPVVLSRFSGDGATATVSGLTLRTSADPAVDLTSAEALDVRVDPKGQIWASVTAHGGPVDVAAVVRLDAGAVLPVRFSAFGAGDGYTVDVGPGAFERYDVDVDGCMASPTATVLPLDATHEVTHPTATPLTIVTADASVVTHPLTATIQGSECGS